MPVNILPVSTIYWEIRSPSKYIEKKRAGSIKTGEYVSQELFCISRIKNNRLWTIGIKVYIIVVYI